MAVLSVNGYLSIVDSLKLSRNSYDKSLNERTFRFQASFLKEWREDSFSACPYKG